MPRPAKQESVVFDLVEENGPDGDAYDDANGAADEVRRRPDVSAEPRPLLLVRLSRLPRRTWVLTAVAVAIGVVTAAAVDLVRDHRPDAIAVAFDRLREHGYTLWTWDTGTDATAGWMTLATDDEGMRVVAGGLGIDVRTGAA